jgi:hypothetical protein
MKQEAYAKTLEWLKTNPALDELCAKFPEDWAAVQRDIAAIVERGVAEELKAYLERVSKPLPPASFGNRQPDRGAVLAHFVRSRMAHESVKKLSQTVLAAELGVTKGKLRFNWFNGFVAQHLLFSSGLKRKPVSLFWFRLLWPLVWQRKRLMPLVQPKGIYCFYSRELVAALSALIASRCCLEIGAGDGTLARFLQEHGVQVTATDNHEWEKSVAYPDWVQKMDAREALKKIAPEVVICSWPPAQNDFEREVFSTASVQLYIVIGSRHQYAFGNWKDYQLQTAFALTEDTALSALVLPPELEPVVYVFRRKAVEPVNIV